MRFRGAPTVDGAEADLVVLESFPVPRPTTNPYIVMLWQAMRETPGLRVRTFSWRDALLGRYDVFHVHWPDILVSGQSPAKKAVRQLFFALLLLRLVVTRTPLVRTHHNLGLPDGISRRERVLLRAAERLTTLWIVLNPAAPQEGRTTVQILHGHYRDWFARYPAAAVVPGRLAYFGLVRTYKNVESLIGTFRRLDGDVSLTVSGRPDSEELAARVREAAAVDDRVEVDLRFLDEGEVVSAVTSSEVVVLPYLDMHNSGSVLAALSMARPVLVPANPVNALLADEVGRGWVQCYEGELTEQHLAAALARADQLPAGSAPDLRLREWSDAGVAHRDAFAQARAIRRGRTG